MNKKKAYAASLAALSGVLLTGTLTAGVLVTLEPTYSRMASDSLERREVLRSYRIAYAGDSITAGCVRELRVGSDPCSWTGSLDAQQGMNVVGGFARWGASSKVIAENVPAMRADVLVILAGTNNYYDGIWPEEHIENFDTIASIIVAREVVVVALPPIWYRSQWGDVESRNEFLRQSAAQRGWLYVDPWDQWVTDGAYDWTEGATLDGVHPVPEVQAVVGAKIAEYIRAAVP